MRAAANGKKARGLGGLAVDAGAIALLGAAVARLRGAGLPAPPRGRKPASTLAGKDSRTAPASAQLEPGRGRQAQSPRHIPAPGWKDILKRTWKEFNEDHVTLVAAGVTFYTLLAFFPGLGAFVALYGLFADVNDAREQLRALSVVLSPDILDFVGEQMLRVAQARSGGLSFAFVFSLLLSIWSANGAMKSIFLGLNIAYEEEERRGFVRVTLTSLAFTLGALLFVILAFVGLVAAPTAARFLGTQLQFIVGLARWPILAAALIFGITLLYRYGPSRDHARWRWVNWGAALVTVVWIAASAGFSFYLANFGNYDKTYGSLGALFGFMMWTYVSAVIVLLGAELNAEIEHQTAVDTTTGAPRPMGARGARMADTLGAAQR